MSWIDDSDPHLGGTASKGIGELAIVGTADANAVCNATSVRVRDLPIHLGDLLAR